MIILEKRYPIASPPFFHFHYAWGLSLLFFFSFSACGYKNVEKTDNHDVSLLPIEGCPLVDRNKLFDLMALSGSTLPFLGLYRVVDRRHVVEGLSSASEIIRFSFTVADIQSKKDFISIRLDDFSLESDGAEKKVSPPSDIDDASGKSIEIDLVSPTKENRKLLDFLAISPLHGAAPKKPVRVGEKWVSRFEFESPTPFSSILSQSAEMTNYLVSVRQCPSENPIGHIAWDASLSGQDLKEAKNHVDVVVAAKGRMVLDLRTGMVLNSGQESTTTYTMNGEGDRRIFHITRTRSLTHRP